jgi:outer membrane autotransporter protein
MALLLCRFRQATALAVVASFAWVSYWQQGHAQALPPYSIAVGLPSPTGLTTLPGLNDAQQAMAQSINNFCPTVVSIAVTPAQRDLANICSAMIGTAVQVQNQPNPLGLPSFGISSNALSGALTSLNGGVEVVVPTSQGSVLQTQQSSLMGGVVEARLSALRSREGNSGYALAVPRQLAAATPYSTPDVGFDQSAPNQVAYWNQNFGLYMNWLGQFGNRDTTARQNGNSFSNAGVILGADYRFTPQLAAGASFGYTHANTDFDTSAVSAAGQSLDSDLFQGTLYATYSLTNSLYLNGSVLFGGGSSDSRRRIVIPSSTSVPAVDRIATGSFGVADQSASLGGGYVIPLGALTITPTARFQYLHVSSDGFTESGASGLDLRYGGSAHNVYLSYIGGQAQYAMQTRFGILYPSARFDWVHQYNSGNAAVSVAYSNDPLLLSNFVFPANRPDRDYFDVGVGLALQLTPNQSAFVNYDAIVGLRNTSYNSIVAGLRVTF